MSRPGRHFCYLSALLMMQSAVLSVHAIPAVAQESLLCERVNETLFGRPFRVDYTFRTLLGEGRGDAPHALSVPPSAHSIKVCKATDHGQGSCIGDTATHNPDRNAPTPAGTLSICAVRGEEHSKCVSLELPSGDAETAARTEPVRFPATIAVSLELQPVFEASAPTVVRLIERLPARYDLPSSLSDEEAKDAARRMVRERHRLATWFRLVAASDIERLIGDVPLRFDLPAPGDGLVRSGQRPDFRVPANCSSLFRAMVERDALLRQNADVALEIETLKAQIGREEQEAGVLGWLLGPEGIGALKQDLKAKQQHAKEIEAQIADRDLTIARRTAALPFENRLAEYTTLLAAKGEKDSN